MSWLFWAAFITLCSVSYQSLTKLAAGKLPLFVFTATVGLTIFTASLIALALSNGLERNTMPSWRTLLFIIGIGVISFGIELGFFQMYAAGGPLSIARMIPVGGAGVLLVLVGVFAYGERLTLPQCVGIVVTLVGLYLMTAYRHA